MKQYQFIIGLLLIGSLYSCSQEEKADGYGNFEATQITVSAEANGKLIFLNVEEGQELNEAEQVGLVDTLQLHLTKMELLASQATIKSRSGVIWSQMDVLQEELKNAKIEQNRIHNLFAENAATQQQVDQADSRVRVLNRQISSAESQNAPIVNEVKAMDAKIVSLNEQLTKSKITNPIKGTVLTKYAESGEIVAFGKPLYKIADLSLMELRVYVSQTQIPELSIGKEVQIKIDAKDGMKTYPGTVSWIASEAEFTPKIIQTKEERVNLVYAVKIAVKNDGSLKIGMPAEMWLTQ